MKWIKYQIVCGKNQNEEDILINKKVGYSAENIAIAEKEAYNGYTIEEDAESFDKEPLAIELGGTRANNANDARKNLGAFAAADYDGLFAKTGNPVQANLKKGRGISAITTMLPAQLGSGNPYPAGGGKNLLPDINISSGGFTSSGNGVFKYTSGGNINTIISTFLFKAGITYTISATTVSGTGYKPCIIVRNPTGSITGQKTNYGSTDKPLTFSFDTDTNFNIILQSDIGNGLTTVNDSWAIQLEVGSAATEYAPYANIRTISGWTGAKLTRCGKNLFDKDSAMLNSWYAYSSEIPNVQPWDGVFASKLIPVRPGEVFTLTNYLTGTGYGLVKYLVSETDTGGISGVRGEDVITCDGTKQVYTFTVPDKVRYIGITGDMANIDKVQLELGSAATEYEPYQGDTYTADFGQTVYGGTLDWQTGALTVDKAFVEYDGSTDENWAAQNTYTTATDGHRRFRIIPGDAEPNTDSTYAAPVLASMYRAVSPDATYSKISGVCVSQKELMIYDADRATLTVDGWKAWLSEHPVQIVYKLATPTTIQLTPQEMIEALGGVNTIYTDCGSNDVTFNHDLTLLNAVPKPTPESIGAAPANHTHTPESIGAAKSNHTHADFAYSEAEVNTGKTWIDGKPIYKKTIAITSTISASAGVTTKVVGAILDIDVPIKIYGAVAYHSDNAPYTWYQLGSHVDLEDKMWTGSTISAATGQVKLYVSNLTIGSGYITVEYTKKTN